MVKTRFSAERVARLTVTAATGAALVSLAACGDDATSASSDGSDADSRTVTEMDFQYEGQSDADMRQALDVCTEALDIDLDREAIPFDQFVQQVLLSASSQDLPDVMFIDYANLPQIAETGALVSLDELGIDYAHIQENVLDFGRFGGEQYGAAPGVNTLALFYNREIFDEAGLEPPTTWDELRDVAGELTTADRYGLALSANAGEEAVFQFQPFLWSNAAEMTDLGSPAAVEALEFVTGLVEEGYVSRSVVNWSQADVNDQFISGNAAMQVNGSWQIPVLQQEEDLDWDVVPIPAPAGQTSVTPFGGENWVVTAEGADNPAAVEFVQCMIDDDAMMTWADAHYYVPTNAELGADFADDRPEMAAFVEAVGTARNKLQNLEENYADASNRLSTAVQAALTGTLTPAEALQEAAG